MFSNCDSINVNWSTTANLLRKEISILLKIKGNKFNNKVILTKSSCFEVSHKEWTILRVRKPMLDEIPSN